MNGLGPEPEVGPGRWGGELPRWLGRRVAGGIGMRAPGPFAPALALALALITLAPAPARPQDTQFLVVSGLSGEDRFARDFSAWTEQLVAGLERQGVARSAITVLSEKGTGAARATKENVAAAVKAAGARAGADGDVAIVLFGHGSESAGVARLNLPGPDLAAPELATLLDGLRVRRTIVVNTASASGGFVKPLAGKGRVLIAATKSGAEQNETMFPRHFVAAFGGAVADADRDGRISLLEAFTYAKREVERAYSADRRLLTEHAVLEADGDGIPDAELAAARGDGAVASTVFFGGTATAAAAVEAPAGASDELRALYEEKRRIEGELAALRARRESLPAAEYQRALEALLLELARNGQAIRRLEGGS